MKNIITSLEAIIEEAENMKGAYFYKPPYSASARRSYEVKHSHDKICWNENGHEYTAEYVVSCSCNNVYAYGVYTKDGNKTTLTAIRNSYKRMKREKK